MDAFLKVGFKRRKTAADENDKTKSPRPWSYSNIEQDDGTDEKLAILASIFEDKAYEDILEALLKFDGNVELTIDGLLNPQNPVTREPPYFSPPRKSSAQHVQSALKFPQKAFTVGETPVPYDSKPTQPTTPPVKPITRKGQTLTLYTPSSISQHTPCTIIHNFLPPDLATSLIQELLPEVSSYSSAKFRLFDNIVSSPHTACFYLESAAAVESHKTSYLYNGSSLSDVRTLLPAMRQARPLIQSTIRAEIAKRAKTHPPASSNSNSRIHHPADAWTPNAAFVNCYDGPLQNVGYHADSLTYLGPRPTIASLSLGVTRDFRIRRVVPPPPTAADDPTLTPSAIKQAQKDAGDLQGQIVIPLPHNSLLIMHADSQEYWKHAVTPVRSVVPHAVAGVKRLNITYRWYREEFAPKYTPRCRCTVKVMRRTKGKKGTKEEKAHEDNRGMDGDGNGNRIGVQGEQDEEEEEEVEERVPCVLKSVMKRKETLGRYVWMCQTSGRVDPDAAIGKATGVADGCGMFEWAEFDDHGVPVGWTRKRDEDMFELHETDVERNERT